MKKTLLCVLTHPTQYDPPMWSCLERRGKLKPVVWYLRRAAPWDPELRRATPFEDEEAFGYEAHHGSVLGLARRFRSFQPDAVLTAGWTRASTWAVWGLAKSAHLPVLLPTDRVLPQPRGGSLRARVGQLLRPGVHRRFDGFITTGSLGREALQQVGVPAERIAVGQYPVDVALFRRRVQEQRDSAAALRLRWPGSPEIVLAISKLSPREDPTLVLDAFAQLHRARPQTRLLYVGDGPLRAAAEHQAAELGIGPAVHFAGYIPYRQLPAYYAAADVFVHAPKTEPWGISVSEALACGVPVVATDAVGSAHDLLAEGGAGARVARDPSAIATALESLLQRGGREKLGEQAIAQASKVDVARACQELESLIQRIDPRSAE